MNGSMGLQLLLQAALIALNAVFACAEIAVISINENKLGQMAEQGDKRAVRLVNLTSQPARFLATIQVAITLSGFLGSAFAADNFASRLSLWLAGLGMNWNPEALNAVCVVVITVVLSFFTLVLGELVPKRVAMRKAESLALAMSGMITAVSVAFKPLVTLLTASTNGVLRLLGIDPNQADDPVSEEEIRMMVDAGSRKGVIDETEKTMIQNVFEFDDRAVEEFCTHRTQIDFLWLEDSMEQWEKTIRQTGHSLYPVCGESVDQVVGVLKVRDYYQLADRSRDSVVQNAMRPAQFVPEGVKADVLFKRMQKSRNHFAVVLDEYGGTTGIVTMSDLLEQLVGDLEDGVSDGAQPEAPQQLGEGRWRLPGSMPLSDVAALFDVVLPEAEYDTLGGYVFAVYGEVPQDGSDIRLELPGLRVESTVIAAHRLVSAVVTPLPAEAEKKDE